MTANSETIVVYHPQPLSETPASGSELRPVRMVEAFGHLGFNVLRVSGFARDRRRRMEGVRKCLDESDRIAFAYLEVSTTPTALTQPHHVPTHPLLDYRFLADLNDAGVPTGVFYRDIYWTFPLYKERLALPKYLVAKVFHVYDWWVYRRFVDWLFLPRLQMRNHLYSSWPSDRIAEVPPGCKVQERPDSVRDWGDDQNGRLRLLYVGGIEPSVYDISPTLRAVARCGGLAMTLCCRREDWKKYGSYYRQFTRDEKVDVVHVQGEGLDELYLECDVFVDLREVAEYHSITVPVKLFEALGHGVPYVATEGTAMQAIVEDEGFGWSVGEESELVSLLNRLRRHPERIEEKRRIAREVRHEHTWEQRASNVAEILSNGE